MGPKPNESTAGRDRAFFLTMPFVAGTTVFLGFAQSYHLRPITHATHYPTGIPISPVLHPLIRTHALMFSAWMLLFIAQNTLVATGRIHLPQPRRHGCCADTGHHRLGFLTAVRGGEDGWNPGGPFADSQAFMVVGFGDILVFFGFAAAGLYYRRKPAIHKRFMLLATVGGLMWPAITRMPYVAGRPALMIGLLAALVLAPAVYDRLSYSRFHPVSLWGGLLVLAAFPLRGLVGQTAAWHSFAACLLR